MAAQTLTGWKFHDQHIQANQLETTAISAESTLIAAGPPLLEQLDNRNADLGALVNEETLQQLSAQSPDQIEAPGEGGASRYQWQGDIVFPIGLLESAGISQNKQVQRIFEIGSARSYFIPGRTLQGLNFGRVFFNGPSLLRALYGSYKDGGPISSFPSNTAGNPIFHTPEQSAGFGQFLINLQSDLFNQAFGAGFFFKDQKNRWYGAFYCEMAYLQGHQLSISAGSVLLVEGVSAQFDTVRPIDITGQRNYGRSFSVGSPPAFYVGQG